MPEDSSLRPAYKILYFCARHIRCFRFTIQPRMMPYKVLPIVMSLFSFLGCGRSKTHAYPADTFTARDGSEVTITFFKHASLAVDAGPGRRIYIDPVGSLTDY